MIGRGSAGPGRGAARLSIGAVLGGTLLGFAITFAGAVLMGLAVSLTAWDGWSADAAWFSYISIAVGGMLAARKSRRTGWLHGGLVGLTYLVAATLLFQSGFAWSDLFTSYWLTKAFLSFAAGAAGGVLGINL